jgi:hypothetical protein
MVLRLKRFILLGFVAVAMMPLSAKEGWEVSFHTGTSISRDETLNIYHDLGDITIRDAKLNTKPFTTPYYYGLRVGKWDGDTAWEFEHIHQKVYVDSADLPPQIENFEITDGYNLFYLNHAWNLEEYGIIARAGLGLVVAHPDITAYGTRYHRVGGGAVPLVWQTDSGYQWAGTSIQAAVEKEFQLYESWYLSLEGKATHSSADIDIKNPSDNQKVGSVYLPNTALHFQIGITYHFGE